MKTKGKLNKGVALVLSAALIIGLTPAIPDIGIKSYAAEDTAKPSVQAYADKDTLMGDTFAPNKDTGKNDTVGLLYFGQDENQKPQKWYILGKDAQVKDANDKIENIAIFAASKILSSQCFNANSSSYHEYNVSEDNKNDISYVKGDPDTNNKVARNHYGGSDIRSALRKMSGEEEETTAEKKYNKYFTDTEKEMMQKTTVLTQDYDKVTGSGDNKLYTTSDKLYLASGNYNTYKIINVGSVSKSEEDYAATDEYTSIKLSRENYWNVGSGFGFWLRSPYPNSSSNELYANPSNGNISNINVDSNYGVRPASNLDLSSVLFASAVDAASDDEKGGTITTNGTNQAAMILRLDGSNENIGKFTFTYNKDGITVTKDTMEGGATDTEQGVFLVVQGKTSGTDGKDWYYSKKITDAEKTVSLDTIATTAGIDKTKIDLTSDNCKIWLETPVSDAAKLCYAVTDGKKQHEHVYPTNKATPTELMKSDEGYHWWQCTDEDCPDLAGSIMNMSGESGKKDAHNWVKSQEDADKDKTIFETYFKGKEGFLENGTGNVEHKLNDEDNTKHDKITTYYYYCQDCEYVDKEHTFTYEEKEEHEYTKDNNGYTRDYYVHYKVCLDCKNISDESKHEYDNDNDRECNVCGYVRGHNHFPLEHKDELKPTCTEDGNIGYYYCGNGCDFKSKDSIGMLPLTEQDTIILKATGHKAASSSYKSDSSEHWKICENINNGETCGAKFAEEAHNWVKSQEDADKDKTSFETYFKDKEEFLKDGTGNVKYESNAEESTKHDKITTYYYYCQDCEYVDTGNTFTYKEKEKEDHKYTDDNSGYTREPDKHYKECLVCKNISDEDEHKYDNDDDRDCNVCGYERGHEHYPLEHKDELKPTCTENGNIEYYHCVICDFKSKDSIGMRPLTEQDTIILKAIGHKAAAASYESDSSKHWKICENINNGETCKARFAEGAHNFSGNKCTECGYTKSSGGSSSGMSNDSASGKAPNIIHSENWSQDASGRWWYYDGNTKVIGWAYDKPAGKWYYVDESKGMLTGWIHDTVDGYWYYLDADTGEMLTGWQLINGKQYYFATAPEEATYVFNASSSRWVYSNAANYRPYGSMYAGTITPDNQRVDADGARIQ